MYIISTALFDNLFNCSKEIITYDVCVEQNIGDRLSLVSVALKRLHRSSATVVQLSVVVISDHLDAGRCRNRLKMLRLLCQSES